MSISAQQFAALQKRLAGNRPQPGPVMEPTATRSVSRGPRVILGVDPSLRGTGYGILRQGPRGSALEALAYGTIKVSAGWERSRCLARISQTLRELLQKFRPTVCVMEGLFYAQNLKTAIIMGEARGAALAAVGESGVDIFEIAPRKMKQAIVGYGAAQKTAVARMVQRMLNLESLPEPDAADALALALAHAQQSGGFSLAPARKL